MQFQVSTDRWSPFVGTPPVVLLVEDGWDDWGQFNTMYSLYLVNDNYSRKDIGSVKIGQIGMKPKQRRPDLPKTFEQLDLDFFSLGQDDSYYERLNEVGPELRDAILGAINDLAYADSDTFHKALNERVTQTSILRSVSKTTVRDQFRRIARGGARLSRYHFEYAAAPSNKYRKPSLRFTFDVEPNSQPPTNIHVIIGRNGVGKTHFLNAMSRALVHGSDETNDNGQFISLDGQPSEGLFANLVSVTFSAFDPFEPLSTGDGRKAATEYRYIGLKRKASARDEHAFSPKSLQMLSLEFSTSANICRQGARAARWARALKMLESDPIFRDAQVASLAPSGEDEASQTASNDGMFSGLSSGHKIVLLTITRLVETVAERTLVLLDEPETHLHPPLLSAFVRALSDLLIDRNGVAIIATHSPVVLQEVPKSCVWKLRKSGASTTAERPEIETFGENVGILTREVFGLEVTESGFHRLLSEAADESGSYEEAIAKFKGELGGEAKAIVRALLASRNEEVS